MKYLQHTSLVAPFPSVGQRRQNRTSTAISRQQGDPFDRCVMLPPRGKVRVREGRPRERETQRSPCRPVGKGFKCAEMGLRFRAFKARKPLPSGGYLRNLLRRAGSLGLPLLVLVFRRRRKHSARRREKYTPKRIDSAETIPPTFPNKKHPPHLDRHTNQ